MVRNPVFLLFFAGLIGFGIFYFVNQRRSPEAAAGYSVASEPLQNWDKFDTDQGATWKYMPILMNRSRIVAESTKKRTPQAAGCPTEAKQRGANAWLRWRREIANRWNNEKTIERSAYEEITACKAELEALSLWNCFDNVKDFSFQATLNIPNKMGFEVSDTAYYKKILDYDKEALKLPNELKDGVPNKISAFAGLAGDTLVKSYEGLNKINSLANWKVVKYLSRTVANPHPTNDSWRSYNRLLFVNSTPRYDKYIQFTLPQPSVAEPFGVRGQWQQLVDFISVEKIDKSGNPLDKPVLRFAQFNRDENGRNPKPRLDYLTGQGSADTCYTCHPGGMRIVSPLPSSVTPLQYKALQTINDKMASYKTIDWDGAIHPDYYGPPRGATIGCMDCHNNGHEGHIASLRRGPVNHFTSPFHISHKLRIDYSMTQARLKGHLSVLNYVKGIDRFTTNDADVNKKLDQARAALFEEWIKNPSSLVFEVAFKGAKKIAAIAEQANIPYLPKELMPDDNAGEAMDQADPPGFLQQTSADQKLIEQTLMQQNDNRYKIETANWMELRCPDTPIEARE